LIDKESDVSKSLRLLLIGEVMDRLLHPILHYDNIAELISEDVIRKGSPSDPDDAETCSSDHVLA
jgi:hypothetical protein